MALSVAKALLSGRAEALCLVDLAGQVVGWSAGAQRLFGWQASEVMGHPVVEHLEPWHTEEELIRGLNRAAAAPVTEQVEWSTKAGGRALVEETLSPVRDSSGALVGYLLAVVEPSPADERARLAAAMEGSAMGAFVSDLSTGLSYRTPRLYALLGYTAAELGPTTADWARLLHPDDRADMQRSWTEFLAAPSGPREFEYRVRHRDGTYRWVSVRASVREVQGRLQAAGTLADVTARHEADTKAQASIAQLRAVVDGSDGGSFDWDLSTGHVSRNDRLYTLLGYLPGEIAPNSAAWLALVHPEDQSWLSMAWDSLRTGLSQGFEREYRVQRKDGTWAWLLARGKVTERSSAGKARRISGTVFDVTTRRLVEERLKEELALNTELVVELQQALAQLQTLGGLLPICMHCHKIRNDQGYWERVDSYLSTHSKLRFSHGLCEECERKHYP